ncbi:hypothetical protein HXW87_19495, partial [Pseudomonas sp. Y5-11]
MCGGNGGTLGSVLNSISTGTSEANALSQAAATSSSRSTKIPFRPMEM